MIRRSCSRDPWRAVILCTEPPLPVALGSTPEGEDVWPNALGLEIEGEGNTDRSMDLAAVILATSVEVRALRSTLKGENAWPEFVLDL